MNGTQKHTDLERRNGILVDISHNVEESWSGILMPWFTNILCVKNTMQKTHASVFTIRIYGRLHISYEQNSMSCPFCNFQLKSTKYITRQIK